MSNIASIERASALYEAGRLYASKVLSSKNENHRDKLYQDAKSILLRALLLQEVHLNRNDTALARTRMTLAHLIYRLSDTDQDEALALANFALAEQVSNCPEENKWQVAETLLGIASLHLGAFSERIIRKEYVERALAIVERYDNTDPRIISVKVDSYSMMEGCLGMSQLDEKIAWERRALELLERYLPNRRKAIFSSHQHLAWLANYAGDYPMELLELEKAIRILRDELLDNKPENKDLLERLESA